MTQEENRLVDRVISIGREITKLSQKPVYTPPISKRIAHIIIKITIIPALFFIAVGYWVESKLTYWESFNKLWKEV